eukprot:TRINITY_DN67133_c7_g8_i2.p1 TRINITY_DN67133_c7_g8~~TRINITY_DN67133_c7_g8_i2.p1  ORF type:complete len:266 (+),score=133.20 TRINITY_DN67133_c7_g8_i2:374-1171(+)
MPTDRVKLEEVPECTTGRVFLLRFSNGRPHLFFWMQEPKPEGDKELWDKVRKQLLEPSSNIAQRREQGPDGSSAPAPDAALLRALGLAPQAAQQGGSSSSSSAAASSSSSSGNAGAAQSGAAGSNGVQSAEMQALAARMQAYAMARQQQLSLTHVLKSDNVVPMLDELDAKEIEELCQHLPEGQQNRESLLATLRSPQLRQTLGRMSSVLNSAQYGQVLASLGLPIGSDMGVAGFVQAIKQQVEKEKNEQGNNDNNNNNDDDDDQ